MYLAYQEQSRKTKKEILSNYQLTQPKFRAVNTTLMKYIFPEHPKSRIFWGPIEINLSYTVSANDDFLCMMHHVDSKQKED